MYMCIDLDRTAPAQLLAQRRAMLVRIRVAGLQRPALAGPAGNPEPRRAPA